VTCRYLVEVLEDVACHLWTWVLHRRFFLPAVDGDKDCARHKKSSACSTYPRAEMLLEEYRYTTRTVGDIPLTIAVSEG
jgi:hypothetical protein